MGTNNRIFNSLLIVATVIPAAVGAYVTYDVNALGPVPEKTVELDRFLPINPMRDLSALGDRVTLTIKIEDQTINNLVIAQAYFRNRGKAPVLPSEYHENLSVNVKPPWKIVAVENSGISSEGLRLTWSRVSDVRYEAAPALLNPGDLVGVVAYLTNTESQDTLASQSRPDPRIEWNARISNLRGFTERPKSNDTMDRIDWQLMGMYVELIGWGIPFMVVVGLLLQTVYLQLLFRLSPIRGMDWRSTAWVLGTTFLSFAVAQAIATYLFGSSISYLLEYNYKTNAALIVVHVLVMSYLAYRASVLRKSAPAQW